MSNPHAPTPEFRSFLEDEVARSFHAAPPTGSSGIRVRRSRVRTIATVLAAVAFGAIAGAAPTQVQDARQREMLTAAADMELKLAAMRLDLARTQYEEARKKYEVGIIGRTTLAMSEAELRETELALARLRLDQEEMRATAAPPNDALTAPLIGSRDFVSDRMKLAIASGQQRLRLLEEQVAEAERRGRLGAESEMVPLQARAELEMAKSELAMLAGRLDLRRDYLAQELTREQIEQRLQRMDLMHEMSAANQMQRIALERVESLRRLQEHGLASQVDLKRAELELLELQLQLQRLSEQMKALAGTSDLR